MFIVIEVMSSLGKSRCWSEAEYGDCDAGEGSLDDFLELVHVVWLEVVWVFNTVDIWSFIGFCVWLELVFILIVIFIVLQIVCAAFQREYFTGQYAYGREGACKWDYEEHCYEFWNDRGSVFHGLCDNGDDARTRWLR